MSKARSPVVNVADAEGEEEWQGDGYGGHFKDLTPSMPRDDGALGVNLSRVPPGRSVCPFHYHQVDDEVFYVLSGTGVLRYGDDLYDLGPGDCVSCPAGTQTAHQIANTGDEDLVFLAIGRNDPNEVCVYPDSDKIMVRGLRIVSRLGEVDYYEGEPAVPRIFELAASGRRSDR